MVVVNLCIYLKKNVPEGFVPVDIENEIRKAPQPVLIVIDLIKLYEPLSQQDNIGLLCGGRFNVAYSTIDAFFGKLVELGAKLVFFGDGPVLDSKYDAWLRRQDDQYEKNRQMIDMLDFGMDIGVVARCNYPPYNERYPLRYLARKHGTLVSPMGDDPHLVLAAYATREGALAIIASDMDYLIYEGKWRMWAAKHIDFGNLKGMEFSRKALLSHLGLTFEQMALFGTLAGNDIIQYDEVKRFLNSLRPYGERFLNLVDYVREQPVPPKIDTIMTKVFGYRSNDLGLRERFQKSLQLYRTNFQTSNLNPEGDIVQDFLLRQNTPLFYQIWHGMSIYLDLDLMDMRGKVDFGPKHNELMVTLVLRMAGIIRYDRREKSESATCEIVTKLEHTEKFKPYILKVVFPEKVEPPPLDELTCQEPDIRESYLDIKYQLCAWVVSDQLEPLALKSVPSQFLVTVLTLSYLVDMQVIKMFEADLFLQLAYDMIHNAEKFPHDVTYPKQLESRPLRLTFLYQRVYDLVAKVVQLVGLDGKDFRDDPFLDGVAFHNQYASWREGQSAIELESIKKWRVYDFQKV